MPQKIGTRFLNNLFPDLHLRTIPIKFRIRNESSQFRFQLVHREPLQIPRLIAPARRDSNNKIFVLFFANRYRARQKRKLEKKKRNGTKFLLITIINLFVQVGDYSADIEQYRKRVNPQYHPGSSQTSQLYACSIMNARDEMDKWSALVWTVSFSARAANCR